MGTREAMLLAFLGFSAMALLSWFFSSRPRLYLCLFVPREEWLEVARDLRRENFRASLRQIAWLQFGIACLFGLAGLVL